MPHTLFIINLCVEFVSIMWQPKEGCKEGFKISHEIHLAKMEHQFCCHDKSYTHSKYHTPHCKPCRYNTISYLIYIYSPWTKIASSWSANSTGNLALEFGAIIYSLLETKGVDTLKVKRHDAKNTSKLLYLMLAGEHLWMELPLASRERNWTN